MAFAGSLRVAVGVWLCCLIYYNSLGSRITLEAGHFPGVTVTGQYRQRYNFSINHLLVAAQSAREAHTIEQANVGASIGEWFSGMTQKVPVSIVMSAAALEAWANEIMQDLLDDPKRVNLSEPRAKLISDLKDDRKGIAMLRFRKLALILDQIPDCGSVPWQDADLLASFRNEFMHFRPAWSDHVIHSGDFVQAMKKRVPVVDAYRSTFQFPYGFMTYGCAKWSVNVVLAFADYFSVLIGHENKFVLPGLDFSLS